MNQVRPRIVFSPEYDIKFFGVEKLHPFDSCKYSRAWNKLLHQFGGDLRKITVVPEEEASTSELELVHSTDYLLTLLKDSQFLAKALEVLPLAIIPSKLIDWSVLRPMRLATKGTIIAAKQALECGVAVNLSGGYHHASRDSAEGFCIYSDIAVAIQKLRQEKVLEVDDKVIVIDLDAHQGNGTERVFYKDRNVYIFDMYNKDIYPQDRWARKRIDYDFPLDSKTDDVTYLNELEKGLERLIEQVQDAKVVFYNAGTDIYDKDPLGKLRISAQGILERDKLVLNSCVKANIPCAMVLSGGYTRESYELVARTVSYILEIWGIHK